MLKVVKLSDIDTRGIEMPKRDDPRVVALIESIEQLGQLQPVMLTEKRRLVFGRHRVTAMRALKMEEVAAMISDLDELGLKLARIDENLVRQTFTALERAEQLEERKRIYEAMNPTAKHGGAPGKKGGGKSKDASVAGFAKDTAAKTGTAERTVQQYVQVAKRLDPQAKAAIKGTGAADDLTGLTALSRMAAAEQQAVAARVAETGESVKKAQKSLRRAAQDKVVAAYVPLAGIFQLHTVDFSWPYDDTREGNDNQRGLPYPPQTLEQIVEYIRGPLARSCDAKGCVVGNWITGPISIDSRIAPVVQREFEALGFKMVHERIWKKVHATGGAFIGQGTGIRWNAEKLQIYVRGEVAMALTGGENPSPLQHTVFEAPVGEHSEKPQKAYDDLEALFPLLTTRLEHYARAQRKGWAGTGAELEKPAAPPPISWMTKGAKHPVVAIGVGGPGPFDHPAQAPRRFEVLDVEPGFKWEANEFPTDGTVYETVDEAKAAAENDERIGQRLAREGEQRRAAQEAAGHSYEQWRDNGPPTKCGQCHGKGIRVTVNEAMTKSGTTGRVFYTVKCDGAGKGAPSGSAFACQECGHEEPKWLNKCPACEQWGTLVEPPKKGKKRINLTNDVTEAA
jgi:N6-adenosine-specific RNA methylase IME4